MLEQWADVFTVSRRLFDFMQGLAEDLRTAHFLFIVTGVPGDRCAEHSFVF